MSSDLCTGFSFDERLGIYFTIQSSCLSAAAVVILLSWALYRWWRRHGSANDSSDASGSSLFLNLMVADLLQAIGNMPSIRWMREGLVTEGGLCTAQAIIKQIGINGVALSSLCIALHTFIVLVLDWRIPRHASKVTVLLIWVFTALVVGIPNAVHRNDVYYGQTGYWCWIVTEYKSAQIMSEYIWVWASGVIMALLYAVMWLVMRGSLIIGGRRAVRWANREKRIRHGHLSQSTDNEEKRAARAMARVLLFYPAVYIFCFLPNTITRWLYFGGRTIPFQATLFGSAIFAFSGLFNVILYFSTRPEYAVGSAAGGPAVATTLPQTTQDTHQPHGVSTGVKSGSGANGLGGHSPASLYKVESEELQLEETRYGATALGANGRVLSAQEVLHQSPPSMRTAAALPVLGGGMQGSGGNGNLLSPPVGSYNRGHGGGPPLARRVEDDDDDEDYGRLPPG